MKFIHFGCWNNLNEGKGNLKNVMEKLNSRITEEKKKAEPFKFIMIAGDNYYPLKNKANKDKKKKEKEEGKEKVKVKEEGKEEDKKNKKEDSGDTTGSIIYPGLLAEGFDLLPKDIKINMILGNHDLETNKGDKTEFIIKTNIFNIPEENEKGDCFILNKEIENKKNIDYKIFGSEYDDDSKTLILMIDTSIYDEGYNKYIQCYHLLDKDIPPLSSTMTEEDIQIKIREKQKDFIINQINNQQEIKHIILVGHHLIAYVKYKKTQYLKKSDIYPKFKDVLINVINTVNNENTKYYYLCADMHFYQKGIITIENTVINQYIVGTGGNELESNRVETDSEITIDELSAGITYEMTECIHSHGFLECNLNLQNLDKDGKFNFKFTEVAQEKKGGKRYKTRKNKNKKNKKSSKSRSKKRRRRM
jgi:hypothetical protein